MTNFKYVSLFSGIGGFEQAMNKLGGECVMSSEIDKFANQAYEVLYGHKTVGDVTKVAVGDVPDHDVLVGGFPCQAFSVAGKRLGFDDTRGTLFFEVARIAKEKQPKLLLLENVKGLISHDKGKTLDTIIKTLNDIGYTVDFNVMNSKYFGVPQNRERIFIVGVLNGKTERWKIEVNNVVAKGKKRIGEYECIKTFNFDWPTQDIVTTRLQDILEDEVDEKFFLSDELVNKLIIKAKESEYTNKNAVYEPFDGASCYHPRSQEFVRTGFTNKVLTLAARDYKDPKCVVVKVKEATKKGYTEARIGDSINYSVLGSKTRRGRVGKSIAQTLDTGCNQAIIENKPPYRIRKLTPKECFRLQGFADSEFDKLVGADISNSQLYKMAGNAVTVNVIEAIGSRLLKYLPHNEIGSRYVREKGA